MIDLFQWTKNRSEASTMLREVTHMMAKPIGIEGIPTGDVFFFPYGVVVFWGLVTEEEREILHQITPFLKNPRRDIEYDDFQFCFHNQRNTKISNDIIHIGEREDPLLVKLALSHSVAQSTKLSAFEEDVAKEIKETAGFPKELKEHGRISYSQKEISKLMGSLLLQRNEVNLQSDILDTPEFFWEFDEYESHYRAMINYLDVHQRVKVLNIRLAIIQEMLGLLRTELESKQSHFLEWIIIVLIIFELLIALFQFIFNILFVV